VNALQLRLLPCPKPLTERFGADYFKAIPKVPGVYKMSDRDNRLLYVGQSKNLRQRLSSYRHIQPERASRKLVRLIHSVDKIEWESCASAEAARLRENELLRTLRPKFNSVNVYPKAYVFIGLQADERQLEVAISRDELRFQSVYGAFKPSGRRAYAALLRLLWAAFYRVNAIEQFPCFLLAERSPTRFSFELHNDPANAPLIIAAQRWLEGTSDELCILLQDQLAATEGLSRFHRQLVDHDLETARDFFERCSKPNFELRQRFGLQEPIAQERLNDYLVLGKSPLKTEQP
jgi:excinuclease UvrABC nuclease subunit